MTETLKFHIDLAAAAQAPTEFRLLNGITDVVVRFQCIFTNISDIIFYYIVSGVDAINMGFDKDADEVNRIKLFNQLGTK